MKTKSLFVSFVLTLAASSMALLGGVVVAPVKAWPDVTRSSINTKKGKQRVAVHKPRRKNSMGPEVASYDNSSRCCRNDPPYTDPTVTNCDTLQWLEYTAICDNGHFVLPPVQRAVCVAEEGCQDIANQLDQLGLRDLYRPSEFEDDNEAIMGEQCKNARVVTRIIAGHNDHRTKVCKSLEQRVLVQTFPDGQPIVTQCSLPRYDAVGSEALAPIDTILEDSDEGSINLKFFGEENTFEKVSSCAYVHLNGEGAISAKDNLVFTSLDTTKKVGVKVTPFMNGSRLDENVLEFEIPSGGAPITKQVLAVPEWRSLAGKEISFLVEGDRQVDATFIGSGEKCPTLVVGTPCDKDATPVFYAPTYDLR